MSNDSKADVTPKLGLLQWVGPALVGLTTLGLTLTSHPLFGYGAYGDSERISYVLHNVVFLLTFSPVLVAIGAVVIGAFRALAAAPHRQEFQALMALGASRRRLELRQLRAGAVHGAIFSTGATVLGVAIHQITDGGVGSFNSSAAWAFVATAGIGVVTMVVAYGIVAHWVTGGAERSVGHLPTASDEAGSESLTPVKRRASRLLWPWISVVVIVASPLVNRLWEGSGYQYSEGSVRPWWASLLATAAGVLSLATWLAVATLMMFVGARVARIVARLSGRALAAGTHGSGIRAIAADGLLRQTPVRTIAMVAIGTILAGSTAIAMGLNGTAARIEVANELTPSAIVATFAMDPPGFAPRTISYILPGGTDGAAAALPDSLVTAMQDDSRLIVVPAGVIVADPGTASGDSRKPLALMAPSARALDAVSPGAARDLYFAPGFSWGYATSITVDGHELTMHDPFVPAPVTGAPREWVESQVGPVPTSAVLLYPAGDTSVADVLADYDLTGLEVTEGAPSGWHSGGVNTATLAGIVAPLLLLATGLVVALAFTVQRLRAGDYATMSALGATRAALRGATAMEAAVTTFIGAVVGMVFGMAYGAYFTLQTAHLGLTQLSAVAWWNIGFDIVHAPWLTLWALTLAATALAAAGSLLARARTDASSPSEQLREAIKEGAV